MPDSIRNFKFENKWWDRFSRIGRHGKKCNIRYEDLVTFERLLEAWGDFIPEKRSREDVNGFALHLSDNLFDILIELGNETYTHGLYQEYIICDPKKRTIHKASVKDRVIHRLLYNALYSYFDTRYIHDSYSCRIGKGTHKAQARFRNFVNVVSKNYTKPCYILKFDIKKCFQSRFTVCDITTEGDFKIWLAGVAPEVRGKGVWSKMYSDVVSHAKENGYEYILLNTFPKKFPMMFSFLQKMNAEIYKEDQVGGFDKIYARIKI